MLFNSIDFLLYFAVFYLFFIIIRESKLERYFLLFIGYAYYGTFGLYLLVPLLLSTCSDFFLAKKISQHQKDNDQKKARLLVIMSIVFNLLLLLFFKLYGPDVAKSFSNLLTSKANLTDILNFTFPVGISFYTFQTISYVVDVYRKDIEPEESFLNFALYVGFFPQLLAGPIERAQDMLPQIKSERIISKEMLIDGALLVLYGLFQKVVIADNLAPYASMAYENPRVTNLPTVILSMYGTVVKIYCDFAGYTNIARGIALFMGFNLTKNFTFPFFATSARQFWQRWHITLYRFLFHYLYVPLSNRLRFTGGRFIALLATFVFGGLWHGMTVNFALWGLFCCLVYLFSNTLEDNKLYQKLPRFFRAVVWFHLFGIPGHFFVYHNTSDLLIFWDSIQVLKAPLNYGLPVTVVSCLSLLFFIETVHVKTGYDIFLKGMSSSKRIAVSIVLFLVTLYMGATGGQNFVYFGF